MNRPTLKIPAPSLGASGAIRVLWVRDFNEDAVQRMATELSALKQERQEVCILMIDSYGGDVYSLLSMLDLLETVKGPVVTVALKAMSCGAVLLSCGTKGHRFVAPRATVMLHDVSMDSQATKIDDHLVNIAELTRINALVWGLLEENSGKKLKKKIGRLGTADWYLKPDDVVHLNLADAVGFPVFKTTLTLDPMDFIGMTQGN